MITAAAYRPFEGERRVFVIEAADAMADESQNALLKTLEEPAPYVHLVLISSEPAALLETVRSRCQAVRFAPLADECRRGSAGRAWPGRGRAGSAGPRLVWRRGDPNRAAFLVSADGHALREAAEQCVAAARSGKLAQAPWSGLLEAAEAAGAQAGEAARERLASLEADQGSDPAARRSEREARPRPRGELARRARTEALDLGLALIAAWLRDLAAVADGVDESVC